MGLKQLWKIERKEVNRVRNGEGQGWHARQAHAEQNIGLIEKSALSIHAHSNRLLHQTPALPITCMQRIDIYLLSADDLRFNQIKMFLICDLELLQVNPDKTDGAVRRAQMTANCLFSTTLRSLYVSVEDPSTADAQVIYIRNPCVKVLVGGLIGAHFGTSLCHLSSVHTTPLQQTSDVYFKCRTVKSTPGGRNMKGPPTVCIYEGKVVVVT